MIKLANCAISENNFKSKMRIFNELIILGLSEPTLSMVFDNLESHQLFPKIKIINNLGIENLKPFKNDKFEIGIFKHIEIEFQNGYIFLGVNKPNSKFTIHQLFSKQVEKHGLEFINIIHKSSAISSTAQFGEGVHINSLVSIAAFTQIGDFVSINRNSSVGHHTKINDFVTINPGANIAGFVEIGKKSLIGMGVNVLDGIIIGENTIVGAGSVVTKNIPDRVIAYGNPCTVIRKNET